MRIHRAFCMLALGWPAVSFAQVVVPSTPLHFDTRRLGGVMDPSKGIVTERSKPELTRVTTHVILSETREWENTAGVARLGQLIGWDDVVRILNPSESLSLQPSLPDLIPEAVREGKARLLIEGKSFEVELVTLSKEDVEFILAVQTALERQAVAAKPEDS